MDSFIEEFKLFKHNFTQELKKNRMKMKRLEDNVKVKEQQRKHKQASRKRRREENTELVKDQQRKQAEAYIKKRREQDYEEVRPAKKAS